MDFEKKNRLGVHGLYASVSGQRPVVGCCGHGDEPSYL